MKITINNFRCLKNIETELERNNIIYGVHGQGKSSFLCAIAATLSQKDEDGKEIKPSNSQELVRTGALKSSVVIEGDGYKTGIALVSGKINKKSEGDPPEVVFNRASNSPKWVQERLDPQPPAHSIEHLEGHESIWDRIQTLGWDGASSFYSDAASQKKGAWKQVTGKTFGTAIVSTWRPDSWCPRVEAMTRDEAFENLELARSKLDEAKLKVGLDEAEKAKLNQAISYAVGLEEKIKSWETLLLELQESRREKELQASELNKNIPTLSPKAHECPSCKIKLNIKDSQLFLAEKIEISQSEFETLKQKWNADKLAIDKEVYKLHVEIQDKTTSINDANRALKRAEEAKEKLEKDSDSSDKITPKAIETLEKELKRAEEELEAIDTMHEAEKIRKSWESYDKIAKELSRSGIRKKYAEDLLEKVNKRIAFLVDFPISIDEDFRPRWNGYKGSNAERFMAETIVSLALTNENEIFICEDLDTTLMGPRAQILQAFDKSGIVNISACAAGKKTALDVPNFKKIVISEGAIYEGE